MKFVLAASGTHGDVNPYLGVAIELKARGHNVTVATCASYRAKVEAEGVRFHAVRPDLADLMKSPETAARGNDLQSGTEYILKELVLPKSRETYDDLLEACEGADLFITHQVLFPSPLVAERLKIPWISVILSPGIFLSAYDPPLLPPIAWFHGLRKLGPAPHRLLRVWIDRVTRKWMLPIDELRREVRLPPSTKNPVRDGMLSPFGTLGWFSPVLGEPQPDWPANTQVTGFVFFDKTAPAASDSALREFLDAGAAPVVFTLGTSAVTVARDFYRTSLEAVRKSGLRAVLLTGADPRNQIPPEELGDSVFAAEYASYSDLFPRAAAVVHSGGIGTIAQTLRAGVPSIVVPHSADQPDNAQRLARTGAGLTIRSRDYTATRAAAMLDEILKDPRYAVRAREIGARIRGEDGLTKACDALERHARSNESWSDRP
ncbi:MAG: glycosyltransferase [Bryobacteraceae bacterium]